MGTQNHRSIQSNAMSPQSIVIFTQDHLTLVRMCACNVHIVHMEPIVIFHLLHILLHWEQCVGKEIDTQLRMGTSAIVEYTWY